MADLFKDMVGYSAAYIDKAPMAGMGELERHEYEAKYRKQLQESRTVYVGNLAFGVPEDFIHNLFSSVGWVTDIIMGLDRVSKTPCGFCFVEYSSHAEAEAAVRYLHQRKLCYRSIRVEMDKGDVRKENRYWGRGAKGGQVRDEYRVDFDPERGGLGCRASEELGVADAMPQQQGARKYGAWAWTSFNEYDKSQVRAEKRARDEDWGDDVNPYGDDYGGARDGKRARR
eukprot:TRINITY_DN32154_c0_g1_i1.p1 TRINITY_DN32154_c0_g1~~TRINITY_DN32154_c0_g1_i1.p1  ORF type:complete len:248 (+),score=109.08 TRINITY_DN32154_c0_g1_i1:62-745(+)